MSVTPPPTSIKATITYTCALLRDLGASPLSPEAVRQAKFNGEGAVAPLWTALFDLVVLQLCDWPQAAGGALAALHAQAAQERLSGEPPVEGALIFRSQSNLILYLCNITALHCSMRLLEVRAKADNNARCLPLEATPAQKKCLECCFFHAFP